ncbi:MAG: hypothetical protein F4227_00630 [Gammaproteobacteria bacterium]|nr:hypothetical protein [Gammaproteobacteria bacterium]MYF01518.1 hypothetical protein [Gammaproteobacteria bacterium]
MQPNWSNQTIFTGDCLDVMRRMNSECVDLIYLDPPFNSNANYAAPVGSEAAGAEFKDTWGLDDLKVAWHALIQQEHPDLYQYLKAVLDMHSKSMMAYLIYMVVRIMEMKRLLKPTGSIYLHCDPYASHYLKLLLDVIFGKECFRNEIVWCYTGPGAPNQKQFSRKHDIIHWFSKSEKWKFNNQLVRVPHKKPIGQGGTSAKWANGEDVYEKYQNGKIPETWWSNFSPVGRIKSERVGYPTQKPLALLNRIIKASSHEDDVILDPFCGCATACIAAEMLGRQWAGIDVSPKAAELVKLRMDRELGIFYQGAHLLDDAIERTDIAPLRKYNSKENRETLYGKQRGICNGCREHFQDRHLEIDHIVPSSHGGGDHLTNLQLLCGSCNRIKGNRPMEYLTSRLQHSNLMTFAAG